MSEEQNQALASLEAMVPAKGADIAAEDIRAIDTMDAETYAQWLRDENINAVEFDGGSEWELVGNKDSLIDVPFVIARIRFNNTTDEKPYGNFVSVCAFTMKGDKIVFNDGGTGVFKQLATYVEKHKRTTAIKCKGLRVSRYKYVDDEGEERDAATYYLI